MSTSTETAAQRALVMPHLAQFCSTVEAHGHLDVEQFFEHLEAPFAALLSSDDVARFLHEELQEMATTPSRLVVRNLPSQFVIFESPDVTLSLHRAVDADPVLIGLAEQVLVGAIGPQPLRMELYRAPGSERFDLFDGTKTLSRGDLLELEPGTWRRFRPAYDVFRVCGGQPSSLFLTARSRAEHRFRWTYDPQSMRPREMVSAVACDQSLQMVIKLAPVLGDAGSAALLAQTASEHPSHHVRWASLQSLVHVDPERALELLKHADADPHPEIRETAAATAPLLESALAQYRAAQREADK